MDRHYSVKNIGHFGRWFFIFVAILVYLNTTVMAADLDKEELVLGKWNAGKLERLMAEAATIAGTGEKIRFISEKFLNIKYKASTLIGNEKKPEVFVINLSGMDCFTFLDYVEALRLSQTFTEFSINLKKVRYRSGVVSFENRNHFFTDWREFNPDFVVDVTAEVGAGNIKKVNKVLNRKRDGSSLLAGINSNTREIVYIPTAFIDEAVTGRLMTGDYVGIYARKSGLDVLHVGIIIREGQNVFFRNASSAAKNMKVVDQDFIDYISDKSGIVVLRPKAKNSGDTILNYEQR